MKRKIVQHGSSSLTLTLPVKWTEKFHLKKGQELDVEENGPTLIVTTKAESSETKKVIKADEIFTKNDLSHLYQLGYDELEIELGKGTLEEIKERLPNCMGFEIVDQKNNKIYIKSIASTLESEFDNLLRKAFLITDEMGQEILQAMESGKYDKLKETKNLETLNNKYTDICTRILNKRGYSNQNRTMQMYEIIKNIERIADELRDLCDILIKDKKADKELKLDIKEAISYYELFYTMFYKYSQESKEKIYNERKVLITRFKKSLEKSKGSNSLILHHLINIVQKTFEGSAGYFVLIL
jgi:phosphate uptake regulator